MIHVHELRARLGGRTVLDGLDFEVAAAEAVALVGPNGAGKTTALRALAGLVRYEGRVEIDGLDARREPIAAKRRLGYMPQVPAFCEETARGALAFVARLRGVPGREVEMRLEQVGLAEHARRHVRAFSTGMRQRLSLAAALLGDPPVLVLDEPTASLDVRGQAELVELLRGLQDGGRTLLLSSHRSEEIRALAHRIVVLDEGRLAPPDLAAEVAASIYGAGAGMSSRTRVRGSAPGSAEAPAGVVSLAAEVRR